MNAFFDFLNRLPDMVAAAIILLSVLFCVGVFISAEWFLLTEVL